MSAIATTGNGGGCSDFIAARYAKCVASQRILLPLQPREQSSLQIFQCEHRRRSVRCLPAKTKLVSFH